MANWKEKGVVPDSDDEDAFNSQSIISNEERRNDFYDDHNELNGGRIQGLDVWQDFERIEHETSSFKDTTIQQQPSVESRVPQTGSAKVDTAQYFGFPASSPCSPPAFNVPGALLELEDASAPSSPQEKPEQWIPPSEPKDSLPVADEISKSYVQLTSSMSSLLSSPPGTRHTAASSTPSNDSRCKITETASKDLQLPANGREFGSEDMMVVDSRDSLYLSRRSLRQRNPIQLHPYAVEGEKYRRTLMARGMRPLRLAQVQDEVNYTQCVKGLITLIKLID
jgi:hypothetical protein